VPGVLQRSTSIYASQVDLDEAYEVGKKAVEVGLREGTGWMATILRKPGNGYAPYFDKVGLELVANSARQLPADWITDDQLDVTDDFVEYAQPLIGDGWPDIAIQHGLQRFARFRIQFIEKKLPEYLPVRFR
jgi:6-phosphofructokinase 1